MRADEVFVLHWDEEGEKADGALGDMRSIGALVSWVECTRATAKLRSLSSGGGSCQIDVGG